MPKKYRKGRKKVTVPSSAAAVLKQYGVKADAAVAKGLKNGTISIGLLRKAAKYASGADRTKVKLHDVAMAKVKSKGGKSKGTKKRKKGKKGSKKGSGVTNDITGLFKAYQNAEKELARLRGGTVARPKTESQLLKEKFREEEKQFKKSLKELEAKIKLNKVEEKLVQKDKILNSWNNLMEKVRYKTPYEVTTNNPRVFYVEAKNLPPGGVPNAPPIPFKMAGNQVSLKPKRAPPPKVFNTPATSVS